MRTLGLVLILMSNQPAAVIEADPEPPHGRVALGLGIAGLFVGTPMVLTGGVMLMNPGVPVTGASARPTINWPILLGTGIAVMSLGTTGIIVGARRNVKWSAWAAGNRERVSRVRLTPTGWAGRESVGVAIVGRF